MAVSEKMTWDMAEPPQRVRQRYWDSLTTCDIWGVCEAPQPDSLSIDALFSQSASQLLGVNIDYPDYDARVPFGLESAELLATATALPQRLAHFEFGPCIGRGHAILPYEVIGRAALDAVDAIGTWRCTGMNFPHLDLRYSASFTSVVPAGQSSLVYAGLSFPSSVQVEARIASVAEEHLAGWKRVDESCNGAVADVFLPFHAEAVPLVFSRSVSSTEPRILFFLAHRIIESLRLACEGLSQLSLASLRLRW